MNYEEELLNEYFNTNRKFFYDLYSKEKLTEMYIVNDMTQEEISKKRDLV